MISLQREGKHWLVYDGIKPIGRHLLYEEAKAHLDKLQPEPIKYDETETYEQLVLNYEMSLKDYHIKRIKYVLHMHCYKNIDQFLNDTLCFAVLKNVTDTISVPGLNMNMENLQRYHQERLIEGYNKLHQSNIILGDLHD